MQRRRRVERIEPVGRLGEVVWIHAVHADRVAMRLQAGVARPVATARRGTAADVPTRVEALDGELVAYRRARRVALRATIRLARLAALVVEVALGSHASGRPCGGLLACGVCRR